MRSLTAGALLGCVSLLACASLAVGGKETSSDLIDILKARAGAVESFKADVSVTDMSGNGRQDLAVAMRQFSVWLKLHHPDWLAKYDRSRSLIEEPSPPNTTAYRYFFQNPGRLRLEIYQTVMGSSAPASPGQLVAIKVYTGDRWQQYVPAAQLSNGKKPDQLDIHAKSRSDIPDVEVARCQGAFLDHRLKRIAKPSREALAFAQVPWPELVRLMDPRQATVLHEPLPSGGANLPVLQMGTEPWKDTGSAVVRIKIWFDPDHAYMPLRLECLDYILDRLTRKHHYERSFVAEWNDPMLLSSVGLFFPRSCRIARYYGFATPVDGIDSNDWPYRTYEIAAARIVFSDVSLNDSFDRSLFAITPATGTTVTDEVSGYHYVIGSAGEQLRKTALEWRSDLPPGENSVPLWWRLFWWGLAGVIVCVVLGFLNYFRRHSSKTS